MSQQKKCCNSDSFTDIEEKFVEVDEITPNISSEH